MFPNSKAMENDLLLSSLPHDFLTFFVMQTNDCDQIDIMYKKCSKNIISLFLWVLNFHTRVSVHGVHSQRSSSQLSLNR